MPSKRLGLTGNIGSGKSTVAKLLVAKGAVLIDSDALAKKATQNETVLQKIAESLGSDLVQEGQLNREKTAALVFNHKEALETLNSIVHPWVRQESLKQTKQLLEQPNPPRVVLYDIPLLFENHLESTVDAVLVVTAPLELRIKRVQERSGLSKEDIMARDKAQLPLDLKAKRADFVIENTSNLNDLSLKVNQVWASLIADQ